MTKTKNTKTWVIALVAVLALGVGLNGSSIVQTVKAQAAAAIKALTNPVTVYDDLYVAGSGTAEEPGDLMVEGKIYGWDNGQPGDLTILTPLHAQDGLQVYGNTQFLMGTTSMESANVALGVNVSGGDLNVANGTVKATGGIGRFYTVQNTFNIPAADQNPGLPERWNVNANCQPNDILIGCSGYTGYDGGNYAGRYWGTDTNTAANGCTAAGGYTGTHYEGFSGENIPLYVFAHCFSPDG